MVTVTRMKTVVNRLLHLVTRMKSNWWFYWLTAVTSYIFVYIKINSHAILFFRRDLQAQT